MSVLWQTSLGDITIDCSGKDDYVKNFIYLNLLKYFDLVSFHNKITDDSISTGLPYYPNRDRRTSYQDLLKEKGHKGKCSSVVKAEPQIIENSVGLVLFNVNDTDDEPSIDSLITISLTNEGTRSNVVEIGTVAEGFSVLQEINACDTNTKNETVTDIRIFRSYVLHNPFPEISVPSVSAPLLMDIDQLNTISELTSETASRQLALEVMGDLVHANIQPSEKVLFVCKLNPITTAEDLGVVFSRFGKITGSEIVKDKSTGKSKTYGFIEFADVESCEEAYRKMDNVIIDDRRIHVDFSQSTKRFKRAKR
ncbi:BA75_01732T0 [Komagataella pastoris]|uniref:Peptidyl-prolyl cis-trans isomerase n=1 Tax=Komagataella pastoris TaxID=4922 RepID=A0A1B2J7P1_PICPA|nr:BA75_01732T0 [Komagataella pastoris]